MRDQTQFSKLQVYINKAIAFVRSIVLYRKPTGSDVLLISSDNARYQLTASGYASPMLSHLKNDLMKRGVNCEHLARPFAQRFAGDCQDNSYQINISVVCTRILDALFKRCSISTDFESNAYRSTLAIVSPRLVVGIELPAALCKGARSLGIPTIELLHGRGIEVVQPYIKNRKADYLPEMFVGFDECSVKTYKNFGLRAELAHYGNEQTGVVLNEKQSNAVLITLQWGYCGDFVDEPGGMVKQANGLFVAALEDCIEKSSLDIQWRFRLHPVLENRSGYKSVISNFKQWANRYDNVVVESSSSGTVEDSIADCFAHITMSSSSVYEAANSGVASLVLCNSIRSGGARGGRFSEIEKLGYVFKGASSAAEILEWVEYQQGQSKEPLRADAQTLGNLIETYLK